MRGNNYEFLLPEKSQELNPDVSNNDVTVITPSVDPTGVEDDQVPFSFKLYKNYPNPFSTSTTITFDVETPEVVELVLFNTLGQRVRVLADGM